MTTALGIFFGVVAVVSALAMLGHSMSEDELHNGWFVTFLISLAIVSLVIGGVI